MQMQTKEVFPSMDLKKQLGALYASTFLSGLRLTDAVWVALLAARGFALWEIGLAEAVYHIISLVFEVPSGMAADLLGRRRTYLLGKGLDSVMNYPFKNAVLGFVCGRDAGQTMTDILTLCEHYPAPALDTALNFLSTHDTERALTVIADEPANGRGRAWQSGRCVTGDAYEEGMLRLRMAYAIIYTLPGVPCLYYGDEIGMQGYRDPFNRGFYCWDSHEERLRPVLAQLAQLRHSCEAFRTGALRVLRAEGGILHYQRIGEAETAEIIVNRTEHIIVEPLASGKHTEVNPMGFTIVVEEIGHNPDHSYYDYQ